MVPTADPSAGLSSGPQSPAGALERLRSAIAASPLGFARRASPAADASAVHVGATATSGRLVLRSHGPFYDALRRPVWIDEFDVLSFVSFQRSGAASPFLYLLVPPGVVLTDTIALEPGSVWIAAEALAPGAPVAGLVGLRIKSGVVEFGSVLDVSRSPVVVPASASVMLRLELDSPSAFAGHGAGEDARRAHADVPANATFAFTPSGTILPAVDGAALTAFGTALALHHASAPPPRFDAWLGRLQIAMAADAAQGSFTVADCQSTLVTVSGSAPVHGAAWSLPVTIAAPSSLGSASGAGGLSLDLDPGLQIAWSGRPTAAACNAAALLVAPGELVITGAGASTPNTPMDIALWDHAAPAAHGTLRLRFPRKCGFAFVSRALGEESFAILTACQAQLDRPQTVNGERLPLSAPAGLVVFGQNVLGPYLFALIVPPPARHHARAFALKNLLLRSPDAESMVLFAAYANGRCPLGALALQFTLEFAVPLLPDPYASNFALSAEPGPGTASPGPLTIFVSWLPDAPPKIDVVLPPSLAGAQRPAQHTAAAADTSESRIVMLDVSTRASQFGVAFGGASTGTGGGSASEFAVADLFLQIQGRDLYVVTLPAVQWEPVLSPDSPGFPSPLAFDDCGNASSFVADTVQLVPIAPRPAIDSIVESFNRNTGPAPVSARFTLPFGIVAHAELRRSDSPYVPSPALLEVAPVFSQSGLAGGDQLSLRAPGSQFERADRESPGIAGFATQFRNARSHGLPVPETVLTPIDTTFDANFSATAPQPRVPLTRIDFSGFGESSFSDWHNPSDAAGVISKARFEVLVGRTSVEVVQAYSVLYPYAVRVVRTITIERLNSGAVVRHDSGWQAVGDGEYRYPKPALVTHPGVVLAAREVVNIRDTGQRLTTSDGSELMAVRFDCALAIEHVTRGSGSAGVPAHDQLGYVQLTDPPGNGQLAPPQYAELLQRGGALGGAVDCEVDIGGSGQHMRIGRVGIAATPVAGGPEFALAAWGSPILPAGGQWSVLRQVAPGDAPQPVDRDTGVPLVRAGAAGSSSTAPYRFADPADLLVPDTPTSDYGLLHATGSQRSFFPRPKIEVGGAPAITSTRTPVLADPFLLGTAAGLFPRVDFALPFPDADYALVIGPGSALRLQRATPSFTLPSPHRLLFESKAVRTTALYADEKGNPSVVTLSIDSAAAESWSIAISNVSLVSESGSHGEVTRVVSRLDASSSRPSQYGDSRLVFGPCLKPVQDVVDFLQNFGPMAPLSISMTNDASLKIKGKLDLQKWLQISAPATKAFLEAFVVDLDFTIGQTVAPYSTDQEIEFELTLKLPTPFTIGAARVVAIALAKFSVKESSDFGDSYLFQLGAGIGVDFKIGGFGAIAYYAETASLIIGDTDFGLATSVLVKGTVDLEVVEIDISVEAAMGLVRVDCNGGADTSIWGIAQVTFALEVTICWVIDIDFEEKAEWTSNWNGGPCALPDVL